VKPTIEIMRGTYRTLDHLSRAAFMKEARLSYKTYKSLKAEGFYDPKHEPIRVTVTKRSPA
jgi:hypothetical protein